MASLLHHRPYFYNASPTTTARHGTHSLNGTHRSNNVSSYSSTNERQANIAHTPIVLTPPAPTPTVGISERGPKRGTQNKRQGLPPKRVSQSDAAKARTGQHSLHLLRSTCINAISNSVDCEHTSKKDRAHCSDTNIANNSNSSNANSNNANSSIKGKKH